MGKYDNSHSVLASTKCLCQNLPTIYIGFVNFQFSCLISVELHKKGWVTGCVQGKIIIMKTLNLLTMYRYSTISII